MKKTYLSPSYRELHYALERNLLTSNSLDGQGTGSDMDDPDYGQNPF